ncbi:MAG: hypothetical protein R2695_05910 [Acidimicrobiales bacterium]
MKKSLLAAGLSVAALPTPWRRHRPDCGFEFEPLAESAIPTSTPDPAAPWMLPDGFTQELVSGETADRCGGDGLDIYGGGLNDWNDMNTVNETGRQPGRYLYRTHEGPPSIRLPDATYPAGGAVSVVDLRAVGRAIAQDPTWTALDGIVWTPWGTALFAEETTGGRLFELIPDRRDPMRAIVVPRPAVGLMAHEGIGWVPGARSFVIDENPDSPRDPAEASTSSFGSLGRPVVGTPLRPRGRRRRDDG